jgi:hypothetical protein
VGPSGAGRAGIACRYIGGPSIRGLQQGSHRRGLPLMGPRLHGNTHGLSSLEYGHVAAAIKPHALLMQSFQCHATLYVHNPQLQISSIRIII